MNEQMRATLHEALEVSEPAGLRSRVIASVPMQQRRDRRWTVTLPSLRFATAFAALLITVALLLALIGTRIGTRPEPVTPVAPHVRLATPAGIAIAPEGTIYVADFVGGRIYRIRTDGALFVVAGGGLQQSEGVATKSNIFGPTTLALGPNGDLYIGELGGTRISRLDSRGMLSTVASTAGPVTGLAFNAPGELYASVSDLVALVTLDGFHPIDLGSVAGPVASPGSLAFDSRGNLYIADMAPTVSSIQLTPPAPGGCRILRVAPDGIVSVIAGTGRCGYSGDGAPAIGAQLDDPGGIAIDSAGNLYVADSSNHRIRRIDAHGIITTIAGTVTAGHTGDGGPATSAKLTYPHGLALDADRFLYVTDSCGCADPAAYGAVRVIDLRTGVIRTVVDSSSRVVS